MIIEFTFSDFREAMRSVMCAASHDKARPHLNCVALEYDAEKDETFLVATDGNWLARWQFPKNDVRVSDGAKSETVLLPLDACAAIAKIKANKAGNEYIKFDTAARTAQVSGYAPIAWLGTNATFPPWRQVIPRDDTMGTVAWIGISADLLARVCKAFDGGVSFEFGTSELDPIVLRSETRPELLAVVMPWRLNNPKVDAKGKAA